MKVCSHDCWQTESEKQTGNETMERVEITVVQSLTNPCCTPVHMTSAVSVPMVPLSQRSSLLGHHSKKGAKATSEDHASKAK
jgi:hypothetical protein